MREMYTTSPDEGCHEVSPGVFCRPVHTSDQKKLMAKGWKFNPGNLAAEAEEIPADLIAAYESKFGKNPHHRMKAESIAKAIADDQA